MNNAEAVEVCKEWLDYLETRKARARKMGELAAYARRGPKEGQEAQRRMRALDTGVTVYDSSKLEAAVQHLVDFASFGLVGFKRVSLFHVEHSAIMGATEQSIRTAGEHTNGQAEAQATEDAGQEAGQKGRRTDADGAGDD